MVAGAALAAGIGMWMSLGSEAEAAEKKELPQGLGAHKITAPELEAFRETFNLYARKTGPDGNLEMGEDDFWEWVSSNLGEAPNLRAKKFLGVLFKLADSDGKGSISFDKFMIFQNLMSSPEADY